MTPPISQESFPNTCHVSGEPHAGYTEVCRYLQERAAYRGRERRINPDVRVNI